MLSIVCVYNNEKILNDFLIKSLKNQTVNYELLTIDNTKGRFKSAAEALNYGGKLANGNYIMFVHQDFDFCSDTWLEEAEKILDSLPNVGVAGIAGARNKSGTNKLEVATNILHGSPPEKAGQVSVTNPEEVQTLDECLIIVPKKMFNKLQFDETVCDGWHLYAVDYCLSAKRLGFVNYVLPLAGYHRSKGASIRSYFKIVVSLGNLPHEYYKTLEKLLNKHRSYFKQIYTTCGTWKTSYPLLLQRIWWLIRSGTRFLYRRISGKRK